jgi:hypothetical protein
MFLAAFRSESRGNNPLKARLPVSDPISRPTTIGAHEIKCGEISLEDRFEGWKQAVATDDVHLFWAWQVSVKGGVRWVTGGITVQRASLKSRQ